MNDFRKWIMAVSFGAALLTPVLQAAPAPDRDDRAHGYYDADHRDYHRWNRQEERSWRGYWTSERQPYVNWEHANEEQRRAYWRWRHEQERRRNHRY